MFKPTDILTYYCFDEYLNKSHNTLKIPAAFKKSELIPVKLHTQADIIFTFNHDQFHDLVSVEHSKTKYIYGLRSVNLLASKSTLATIVNRNIVPKTWVLNNKTELNDLKNAFKDTIPLRNLIIKKNQQRQTGLKIVKNIRDLTKDYVVCQEIIGNPLLLSNRRIAIRIYILFTCIKTSPRFFIYDDGFIYYTPDEYSHDEITYNNTITSGYIDRKIYQKNALTLKDLSLKLDHDNSNSLKKNITNCFSSLFNTY